MQTENIVKTRGKVLSASSGTCAGLSSETLRRVGGPTKSLSTGVTLQDATVRTIFPKVQETKK